MRIIFSKELDTFNDERRGFEFFVNPLAVQVDLTQDDVGGGEDESWDTLWDSAGRITEFGYAVEMAIPFRSLRFTRQEGAQTWRIDMIRIYPRDQRYVLRSQHQDKNRSWYLCQVSKLEGLEGLEQGKGVEIVPTVTAQQTDTNGGNGLESGEIDTQLGLNAKWGFTPNLTLNAALNPDGLSGKYWAIAKRCGERRPHILNQIDLCFSVRNRWVLRVAQMAVADRPVPGRADVGMGSPGMGLGYAVEALECQMPMGAVASPYWLPRLRSHTSTTVNWSTHL